MASFRKKSEIKIEELCRTCLSKDNVMLSIFDSFNGNITIDYIVTSITGIKINKNDGFPSTICCNCKEKAANAYDFKRKTEEAYLSLQSILENDKKECSVSINTIHNMGVKTEDLSLQENDDYTESDFNLSFTIAPELNDLDSVKSEDDVRNKKPFYECSNCLATFKTQNECLQHKKKKCIKIECDDSNSGSCPLCGVTCGGADNITKHMWTHHADLMGPKRRGRPKKALTTTIRDKLSDRAVYIKPLNKIECSYCNQFFKTKEELGFHLITHKGDASDTDDVPIQNYSQPLFTQNQDNFLCSNTSTGGNNNYEDEEYDYNATDDESQSLKQSTIIINKIKLEPETATNQETYEFQNNNSIPKRNKVEESCENGKKCIHCVFDKELDKRNYYFGNLLIGELQFLPPCMRSHAYINILKYIETLKNKHLNKK